MRGSWLLGAGLEGEGGLLDGFGRRVCIGIEGEDHCDGLDIILEWAGVCCRAMYQENVRRKIVDYFMNSFPGLRESRS